MLIKYVFNALVLLMTLIGLCVKSLQANSNISCVNHSVDIVAQSDPNNNHTDTIKLYRGRGRWRCGMGGGGVGGEGQRGHCTLTMTMPPDCSTVHMLIMGAMPMVVPWK